MNRLKFMMDMFDAPWNDALERILRESVVQGEPTPLAPKYGEYSRIYAFTTENIGAYLSIISRPEMKVLCVASSGDHLLNSVYFGARSVTVFDLNRFALYWTELKLVAAASLSFDEFKTFFLKDLSNSPLSVELYERFREGLRFPARRFFDSLFVRYACEGFKLRCSKLFHNQNDRDLQALASNPYLFSENAFCDLKLRLPAASVEWLHSCVTRLSERISPARFDLVLLSNIADYITDLGFGECTEVEPLNHYVREIIAPFLPRLEREGDICAAYLYCVDSAGRSGDRVRSAIHCRKSRREAFDPRVFRLREIVVPSIFAGERDLVCVVGQRGDRSYELGTLP